MESHLSLKQVTRFCSHKCSQRNYKKESQRSKDSKSLEDTMTQMVSPSQAIVTSSSSQTSKDFLCINDISDLLGVSRWFIQRMVQRGQLTVKQAGRKKMMSRQQLESFFKQ
ncbi:MAG: helix-turn-helix domain-containing protein [Saprospiraceae bacterium]|nr:helix-turn-helix domain-containing protein [Saprospiraceae bacterium]